MSCFVHHTDNVQTYTESSDFCLTSYTDQYVIYVRCTWFSNENIMCNNWMLPRSWYYNSTASKNLLLSSHVGVLDTQGIKQGRHFMHHPKKSYPIGLYRRWLLKYRPCQGDNAACLESDDSALMVIPQCEYGFDQMEENQREHHCNNLKVG